MNTLAVILSRAGSRGLRHKAILPLCGRPVITYTLDHAAACAAVDAVCITTDSPQVKELAGQRGVEVIDRPPDMATDHAPVDSAIRHAVQTYESRHAFHADVVVLLYGNVPVRADGIIDRAVALLLEMEADSIRSVTPVGKFHPDWMHRLDGTALHQYRPNHIDRRQELKPLYYHDGAVVVVTRDSLFRESDDPDNHLAFFGERCHAVIQKPEDTVDVDTLSDLYHAEAVLRHRSEELIFGGMEIAGTGSVTHKGPNGHRVLTGAVSVGKCGRR